MKFPDYSRSLLSLASSVLEHFGAGAAHATLPEMDSYLEKNYKNVFSCYLTAWASLRSESI